jgi:hypothetical protein
MATQIGYIDTQLRLDSTGKILLNYGLDSRKDQINTYLSINKGEVPFLGFGNNLLQLIFQTTSEDNLLTYLNQLVSDIGNGFGVQVTDYDSTISNDKITLKLYIEYDSLIDTISFIVSNQGNVLL